MATRVTSLLLVPPGSSAGQEVNAEALPDVTSLIKIFYGRGFAQVHRPASGCAFARKRNPGGWISG
jgi:hypothetical protein